MGFRETFASIIQVKEPLAPLMHLHIGGPADLLVTPHNSEELALVVAACRKEALPLYVLGNGSKVLVRDEGVRGVVLRLQQPLFQKIDIRGKVVRAGAGVRLTDLISEVCLNELSGFETLIGITGTLGGAIKCNAGDRWGEIADYVRRVEVLDAKGQLLVRERSDLHFGDHTSDIDDPVIVAVEFELEKDSAEAIVKRMRKAWIQRNASIPYRFQSAIRLFKHPRSQMANVLIEKAGMARSKQGQAEISERNANWVVAQPGTTAKDILLLAEQIEQRVREKCGVQLEKEMIVW